MVDIIKNILLNKKVELTNRMLSKNKVLSIEVQGASDPMGSIFICFGSGGKKLEFLNTVRIEPFDILDYRDLNKLIRNTILYNLNNIPIDSYDIVLMSRGFGLSQKYFSKPLVVQKHANIGITQAIKTKAAAVKEWEKERQEIKRFYKDTYGLDVINISTTFVKQSTKLYGMNKYHRYSSIRKYNNYNIYNRIKFELLMSQMYLQKSKTIRKTKHWFIKNRDKILDFYNKYLDNLKKKNIIILHKSIRIFILDDCAKIKISYKIDVKEKFITRYIIFKFGDKNEKRK